MRDHFKAEHFLCEEEDCVDEQLTTHSVFRTEIDLRAHIATAHSRGMSKSEVRQARTLDLEFSYTPRERAGGDRGHGENQRGGRRPRQSDTQREFDRIPEQPIVQQPQIKIDSKNEEQFPSLAGPAKPHVQLVNTVRHAVYGSSGLARTKENFPSLGNDKNEKPKAQVVGGGKQYKQPSASSMLKGQTKNSKKSAAPSSGGLKKNVSDFPALSSGSFSAPAFPDFPALSHVAPRKPQQALPKKTQSDFPTFQTAATAKKNRKELMMEDMIEPASNVNMNLVSSKHRGLVEDYVSLASKVSKVQTVQQKDFHPVTEYVKKNVPKLTSADNFPTLGGSGGGEGSGAGGPAWLNVTNHVKKPKEMPKRSKVHAMPVKTPMKPQNGFKPAAEKSKANNNKENKQTKNEEMMEDMIEPSSSVNMNLVSSKHRGLVDDYVSMASKVSKVQTVQQKDIQPAPSQVKKDVPKLNSIDNFPSLGDNATSPPGFESVPKKPPPGFSAIDDYTFLPPQNASNRNEALAKEFQKVLTTPESMQEFRNVSKMFREGNYFPRSYYETCQHVLGAGFDSIFPELLALLPDIQKQQVRGTLKLKVNILNPKIQNLIAFKNIRIIYIFFLSQSLFTIHSEVARRNGQNGSTGAKSKKNNKTKQLEACATCKQVLLKNDILLHLQSHAMENNWK
jgi:E3 ubiquitin-protein ligase ZNF598